MPQIGPIYQVQKQKPQFVVFYTYNLKILVESGRNIKVLMCKQIWEVHEKEFACRGLLGKKMVCISQWLCETVFDLLLLE